MNTRYKFLGAVTVMLGLFCNTNESFANVYAGQLMITNPDGSAFDGSLSDGTGAALWFTLNDDASSVMVVVKEAESGAAATTADAGALTRGTHAVAWDGTGSEPGKRYFFEVTAEQPNHSTTEWTVFFDSGDIDIFTRGADIVRNQASPRFGLLYAPNTGGPLEKGLTIYNPDASFHDPFLVAADISAGGTIDWGSEAQSMFAGVLDEEDRFYVSAIEAGEVRRLNTDQTLTTVITGLTNPKGLWLVGTGADKVLYICDDSTVVRAAIGTEDVFSGEVELVGKFRDGLPRNIAVDDDGAMYVSFRASNDLADEPVALNKYELNGANLPVSDGDAFWFLDASTTLRVADLEIDRGADLSSASDDILYYSTRAGDGNTDDGVWRVDDISSVFPTVSNLIDEQDLFGFDDSANINDRAAIALDPAGNIILMENSNEHIFFLSPPGEGETNSFTTTSADTVAVDVAVSVEDPPGDLVPQTYRLDQNYPNPFNPSTSITYALEESGFTSVKVYNLIGEAIRVLVDEEQPAGEHRIEWDGRDRSGRSVASGIYILTLTSGDFNKSVRMTLLK
jgi:flagellar hook assembly protein FlgD